MPLTLLSAAHLEGLPVVQQLCGNWVPSKLLEGHRERVIVRGQRGQQQPLLLIAQPPLGLLLALGGRGGGDREREGGKRGSLCSWVMAICLQPLAPLHQRDHCSCLQLTRLKNTVLFCWGSGLARIQLPARP